MAHANNTRKTLGPSGDPRAAEFHNLPLIFEFLSISEVRTYCFSVCDLTEEDCRVNSKEAASPNRIFLETRTPRARRFLIKLENWLDVAGVVASLAYENILINYYQYLG